MGLLPIAHNPQRQRLTTALKNICRDYPAGGTVLRELLQNADDAGAKEVRFILDRSTHAVDQLIHADLAKYQGPALLAYNDAVFSDSDFDSLSRLGDSLKLHDGSTTGKFGRGFNSVYNWTDSPSIISRERLLILDPHCEWSDGGPVYDFVANSEDVAMKNHMAAFQTVITQLDQQLEGTVIRIPLRTQVQASRSEISERWTTVSEMMEVLQSFASEFGESGLLFMKNIEKLEIGSDEISIKIETTDSEILRQNKLKVNNAVNRALVDTEYSFDHSFEATIQCRSAGQSNKNTFIVHHNIQCDFKESSLREWARNQKLIPGVAVAAKLPIESTEAENRSLFTVLPLPIATGQPVHVHGQFSLSPDRARLHQLSDGSTQDLRPAKWNNWLLQNLVPEAWAKLLVDLSGLYPRQMTFEKWPRNVEDTRDPLSGAIETVMEIIEKKSLALWPTDGGYLTARDGLLAKGDESTALRDALREAETPVVYVPHRLQDRAGNIFKDRILCPRSLCGVLKSKSKSNKIKLWSENTKNQILEYLISDPKFTAYDSLELFPFKDGIYRCIGKYTSFVLRDEVENDLFALDNSHNLDIEKLSKSAKISLRSGCEFSTIHPSIQFRSAKCLKDYCMSTIFRKMTPNQDMIVLDVESSALVSKVWTWILMRGVDILDIDVSCLWLIPLSNGHHRKVVPQSPSLKVYFAPEGEIGELMWKFNEASSKKPLPLLNTGPTGLTSQSVSILMNTKDTMSKVGIEDASSIASFLRWLHRTFPGVEDVPDAVKLRIAEVIVSHLPRRLTSTEREDIGQALSHLKLFQKVSWSSKGKEMGPILTWTNLSSVPKSIGILDDDISPIPPIEGIQFLSASYLSSSKQLLETLQFASCVHAIQIIRDYIVPAWESGQATNWAPTCKDLLNGKDTSKFALAEELIDPSVPELRELCFDHEEIIPKAKFLRDFNFALKGCGLKTAVDEAVVEHRIRHYANSKYPLLDIKEHAQRLLKCNFRWASPLNKESGSSNLRRLRWLPAINLEGTLELKNSTECRGCGDCSLVSSQLPVLGISISAEWEARLGWSGILPSQILLPQLAYGVNNKHRKIVDAVLTYFSQHGLTKSVAAKLMSISCVLASSGMYMRPSQAFRPAQAFIPDCDRLQPYLANIDIKFWEDHEDLLEVLEIGDSPQLTDLLKIQVILEGKPILEEDDRAVAIEILKLASRFPRASLTGLKVLDATGKLCPIYDISSDDLGPLKPKQKFNIAHPDIPFTTIKKLGIESLRERLIKGMLEIEDVDDEDEFDQRESVTSRIADTLDRYPVETTFREYLANADDTEGASKISWLLDGRTHSCDNLLTSEMKAFQGPAFLVHNDGVFSEKDFKGFKNVGEGSKTQDKGTIGQFGRGSQTMYHWTDVPMILSGRVLLILDPQQGVLPKNSIKGKRKPGVILPLTKLIDICHDQLAPFEGLWGYTRALDNYPGTIFRFPLRTPSTKSVLRTSKRELNADEVCRLMDEYFNEARISLLFLRRIKSIDFRIHEETNFSWSVIRKRPLDEDAKSFSELLICSFAKTVEASTLITGKDHWWVAIEDLLPHAGRLPHSMRRVMKNIECGIAALISSKSDTNRGIIAPEAIQSRMFSTLPLPMSSELPIHIHATFSLSGDRQSISIAEDGPEAHGSEWNRYLLEDALPNLYLAFLDDIGTQVRQRVFSFWPPGQTPKGSVSELLCTSFWKKLPQSSRRLFPKAEPNTGLPQRRAAELFDINQAVFDFLPQNHSEVLTPLLMSLEVKLVRNIPAEVAKNLKTFPEVKSVTGQLLRRLLKSEGAKTYLLKEIGKNPQILEVLFSRVIPAGTDLEDLDGCHLLPLAGGGLATLKYVNASMATSPTSYYVVSEKELQLFQFASRYLVLSTTARKLESVINSAKFNVGKLQLYDLRKLLELKPSSLTPNPEGDKWLGEFWEFWNKHTDSSLPWLTVDDLNIPIFRARRSGVDSYATPVQFHEYPAVVEPSVIQHQKLCDKIPGLYQFDPKFMPTSLRDSEVSLSKNVSFCKFVRAMRKLAGPTWTKNFVEAHLDIAQVKILQGLVVSHVSVEILDQESETPPQFLGLAADLKSIPLWPRFPSSFKQRLVSANDALMSTDRGLLVPWMKDCHLFVDQQFSATPRNRGCLTKLGVKKLSVKELFTKHVLPLPAAISDTMPETKIAVDGKRTVTEVSSLYDHDNEIFAAAFRLQAETRFLHKSVQSYRSFWLSAGLCHQMDAKYYIQCLQVLSLRLIANNIMDTTLEEDSQTVLSLLTSNPVSRMSGWGNQQWLAISQKKVFQSRTVVENEPQYRQNFMASMAATKATIMSLGGYFPQPCRCMLEPDFIRPASANN